MRFIALFVLGAAALSASCARKESAPTSASASPPGNASLPSSLRGDVTSLDFSAAQSQLAETGSLLDDALALSVPDCPRAHALLDRLCALSGHICGLADRTPGAADVRATCKDATERCDRAKERLSTQCP